MGRRGQPGRTVRAAPPAGEQGKRALVEELLCRHDAGVCAQETVDWIGRQCGVAQVMCLVPGKEGSLAPVAVHGIGGARLNGFTLELSDEHLERLYASNQLVSVRRGQAPLVGALPLDGEAFSLQPLSVPGPEGGRAGLLIMSSLPAGSRRDVDWAAGMLAQKLVTLSALSHLATSAARGERERAQLYQIIEAVPDPVALTDAEGRMIIANSRAERLFATADGESEGRQRAVALNNMLFSATLAQQAIGESELARRELPLVDPTEGSDLLFELLSTGTTTGAQPKGMVSILRNVTDLWRASEELEQNYRKLRTTEADMRAERDRLDLIIDSVVDPILVADSAGNLVMMNAPAERLFTFATGSTRNAAQRAVRTNDARFTSFISNVFLTGDQRRGRAELSLIDPDTGAAVPMEAIAGQITSQGAVTAVVTILHDRSEAVENARLYQQVKLGSEKLAERVRDATAELVRQNELLQRQHLELEQASAAKSLFMANMSHEFRTPLNAILGYTSLLLQGVAGELSPQQRKNLARTDSNARHLLGIINDILDISRVEAGKMPLRVSEFSLPELASEVVAELEPLIARSKLSLVREIPPDVPTVIGDRQKVKQITVNLLTNALKFTPQGSVTLRARCDARAGQLAISVIDTGIGIAPQDQPKVFEDFRQVDSSTTRGYGGTGLGLSISRRLAAMLDGKITLASEPGKGSTFTLLLPVRSARTSTGERA